MTREEAIEYLMNISYQLGTMSIEYLSEKDGERMRKAIAALKQEPCENCVNRQAVMDCFKKWQPYMATRLFDFEKELLALPPVKSEQNKCNQCKYYEGVHNVQGHAPCSFLKCGGVLWDWYCSNYKPYKEGEENGVN